jgi:membrane-associated phospholipid phosphatase
MGVGSDRAQARLYLGAAFIGDVVAGAFIHEQAVFAD